ncbi:MAG: type II secretion system GspH family protein [Phycisphaerae bacterium]|nr:type II secretion system GspH family protein [Phycisphaerae bacterium]
MGGVFRVRGPDVRRSRRGFTLIELLVVISIMSLLISILLPALSRARESARRTVCGSNLRQVGTAFWNYAEDFKGWFPAKSIFNWDHETDGEPTVSRLATVQHLGTRNADGPDGWSLQFAGILRDILERGYTHFDAPQPKYLPDPKILICPSDLTGNQLASQPNQDNLPTIPVRALADIAKMNRSIRAPEKNYSYMYVALWRNDDRADFFMMGDESNKSDNRTDSLTGLTPDDNHGFQGINALFCDTRVEWVQSKGGDFPSLQQLAWKLWGPAVSAPVRYPGSMGSRSSEVETID